MNDLDSLSSLNQHIALMRGEAVSVTAQISELEANIRARRDFLKQWNRKIKRLEKERAELQRRINSNEEMGIRLLAR